jgi:cobalt-zinc-cadmium efflux system membrane fusion protein
MNRMGSWAAVLAAGQIALCGAGCGESSESPVGGSAGAGTRREAMVLKLDAEMARGVHLEEIEEVSLPVTLKTFGKIQFNEDQLALVLAPLPGHVVHLAAKVGDVVRAGDVLFMIRSRDVASCVGEYIDSRKDLELSEKTYAMTKDLFENQAASLIALKQAENDLAKTRGRLARTQSALKTLGVDLQGEELTSLIPVRSPISGTVTDRKLTEGQYETADSNPLLTIADLSSVLIVADLFERDLARVALGQKAEVTTPAYPQLRFMGQVSRISDVVDPTTRTVKVRVHVPNPDGKLKPEMFASVLLFQKEAEPALTVPSRAAFIEGGQYFVYLERGSGEFERRKVDVLPAPEGRLRVTNGVKAGEKVVSQDVMLLRAQESGSDPK